LKPADDVARECGLTVVRVLELADAHVIPHWRIDGGAPLFKIREVKDWMARTQLLTRYEGKPLPLSVLVASETPATLTELPVALRPLARDLQVLPFTGQRAGVYFLCLQDRVVYVGQSVCPTARVGQHQADKVFDRVFIYPCLPEHLSLLEGAFIRALRPELNGNPGPMTDAALVASLYPAVALTCSGQAAVALVVDPSPTEDARAVS
jgi:hypothetical protein